MSLVTAIGAGALIGGVAAFAVYSATVPSGEGPVALTAVPTFAAVPTPTVTRTAKDCEPPAVATKGECVVTTPGPTVRVTAPGSGPRTSGRVAPAASDDDQAGYEGDDDDDDGEVDTDDD